ncbi:hypothetical protein AQ714_24370 [Burkholderia pseudomallei]|nr:hypothetical protein BGI47_30655 [Burkholderia pseudomallei]EBA49653.1 conserved hypothetical protein [Burkholderia pseudomallei 305]APZ29086.1 hypothetical protein BGI46_30645 [Burkholderia pseudomallei]KYZ80072.1 hypothetical protein PTBPS01_28255 [Burkholderia pseudomallei]OMQ50221.1 hypothetical protein AQ709_04660 [Burkholderia pseudomallei]
MPHAPAAALVRCAWPRRVDVLLCVAGRLRAWYAAHACAGIADATRAASRHDRARIRASAFRLRNGGGQRGRCAQMSFLTAPPRRAGGIATASLV